VRLGVGLPNSIPGRDPGLIIEWARRAEAGPWSSLGVVDRLHYDCLEPMATLAAVAAATERIGLVTMVVIGPLRNDLVLGAQAASIASISNGRLTLGLAIGARSDDFVVAGMEPGRRGERLDAQLAALRAQWRGDWAGGEMAPHFSRPELLVGGQSDAAVTRVARFADGYVHNGGPPRTFERAVGRVKTAWTDFARPGRPRLWAQGYFALGDDAAERGRDYMRDYYAFTGPFAERITKGLLTTPQQVVAFVRGYSEAGCDELVLLPAVDDLDQLERLADVMSVIR
jgi:alkanesulfonate monooxygenase SsuD/methylene tetrahydromethanopterin reductase-like flavin-dependent oxidoreductase (luciferase family)